MVIFTGSFTSTDWLTVSQFWQQTEISRVSIEQGILLKKHTILTSAFAVATIIDKFVLYRIYLLQLCLQHFQLGLFYLLVPVTWAAPGGRLLGPYSARNWSKIQKGTCMIKLHSRKLFLWMHKIPLFLRSNVM